jgi:hypothetical protein
MAVSPNFLASGLAYPLQTRGPLVGTPLPQPIATYPASCSNCGHPQPVKLVYPPPSGPTTAPVATSQWPQNPGPGGVVYVVIPSSGCMAPAGPSNPPPPSVNNSVEAFGENSNSLEATHECGCGPGCECIGCISHPYNEATQEYIRSIYQSSFDGFDEQNQTYERPTPTDNVPSTVAQPTPGLDYSVTSDQVLSADDFFFVEYLVACPDGENCHNASCVTHARQPEDMG